ncbi:MAG: alanine--tRNA ligase [Chloroflexi bacterium]|nr:alanine--tRNA ligase [Chloroflexota bacterium]
MEKTMTGAQIRQQFIDFFLEKGHTFVPSSSLVPGGDSTLLFTNAGMVQFKDVFLGTDRRPYHRATNSQKCMRVAGKHNDLEDVGRDDTHHTFFEMLGNWSFGDYYKKEAISWAWELLTEVWKFDKSRLYATYFKDEYGEIPDDDEAAEIWKQQPGFDPSHIVPSGRKDNFWEMADTGPCGPSSEINVDRGPEACDMKDVPGHVCKVNGDCKRFVEIWNLVFIQYNRLSPDRLEPLPSRHVDTGMGFERIVSLLQGVNSNYRTDLFMPLIEATMQMTGDSREQVDANFTPYRVIADHARAAAFLIADGVVPGNTGRNYICRMIIRRAARFGTKIGLNEPFLSRVADVVIENYGQFFPELAQNRKTILTNIQREEERFQRTVEGGLSQLNEMIDELRAAGKDTLEGGKAFELYATHGLPLELTRDVLNESGLQVDEAGFHEAMENHRLASGAGKAFGALGGEDVDVYRAVIEDLQKRGKLDGQGVVYDPYAGFETEGELLAIVSRGELLEEAHEGDRVELILPRTSFYVEAGGQVSDTGVIVSTAEPRWEVRVDDVRRPAAGVIAHVGQVIKGTPRAGDMAIATVDIQRRRDVMRNHTATHLLHAELRAVLGEHARQAGSLVAPDRLRFDFTHPEALTQAQIERIEAGVNRNILENYRLNISLKKREEALAEGAMALFGEKYGDVVRTIAIGAPDVISFELCGGTHVEETGDIGLFLITSEGSAAAGVRRIEAVTGRAAYELVQRRFRALKQAASILGSAVDDVPQKVEQLRSELDESHKRLAAQRQELASVEFARQLENVPVVAGVPVMTALLPHADADTLRAMTDRFRQRYPSGVVVAASAGEGRPVIIGAVTDDLVKRGLHAGELVKAVAAVVGGGGGGRPTLAQAGGKDPARLPEALAKVEEYVKSKIG